MILLARAMIVRGGGDSTTNATATEQRNKGCGFTTHYYLHHYIVIGLGRLLSFNMVWFF